MQQVFQLQDQLFFNVTSNKVGVDGNINLYIIVSSIGNYKLSICDDGKQPF